MLTTLSAFSVAGTRGPGYAPATGAGSGIDLHRGVPVEGGAQR
jgi:hypothetical protein